MVLSSSGTNGSITAGYFSVNSDGYLTATGATLTTLTVNNTLNVAKGTGTGNVTIAGDTQCDGNIWLKGDVNINTESASGGGTISSAGTLRVRALIDIDSKIIIAKE
jgi:hypothetical protein